jgi:hypothetical protein
VEVSVSASEPVLPVELPLIPPALDDLEDLPTERLIPVQVEDEPAIAPAAQDEASRAG